MDRDEINKMIKSYLVETLETEEAVVLPQSSLYEDLGMDSLDAIDMVAALEERLDVKFNDDELKRLRTVGDVVDLVERRLKPD